MNSSTTQRRGKAMFVSIVGLAGLGLLVACDGLFSPVLRYKIIVEVNDHGVVRRGSSVWSLERSSTAQTGVRFRGDAVAVDLSGGRTLFALTVGSDENGRPTSNDDIRMLPTGLFGDGSLAYQNLPPPISRTAADEIPELAKMVGRSATLDCRKPPRERPSCPLLVYFKDIRLPSSVVSVDPIRLESVFGDGVSLKSIIVTITDEAVTRGIEKRFSWWNSYRGMRISGRNPVAVRFDAPLPELLSHSSFQGGL